MSHTGGQTQVERFIHGLKQIITAYTLYEVLLESVPKIFLKNTALSANMQRQK